MSQYSGYKFKFNSTFDTVHKPWFFGAYVDTAFAEVQDDQVLIFSAYLFSILSTFPVDIADRFPLITV